jgi:hypothetical protein
VAAAIGGRAGGGESGSGEVRWGDGGFQSSSFKTRKSFSCLSDLCSASSVPGQSSEIKSKWTGGSPRCMPQPNMFFFHSCSTSIARVSTFLGRGTVEKNKRGRDRDMDRALRCLGLSVTLKRVPRWQEAGCAAVERPSYKHKVKLAPSP